MAAKSLAEVMASDAADAVELTRAYFVERLDYSEASVATIEQLVDDVHYSLPEGKTPENTDLMCRLWGAYIGEVFRRHVGGEWVHREDQYGKAVAFRSGGFTVFPHDKVRKRIAGGPEHNLRDYYQVFRNQMSPGRPGSPGSPGR
jgi:hypothetical protein